MSTVSTAQPPLPKGSKIPKKMMRFLLFAIFFGLFMFSMSIFLQLRIHSKHHADPSIYNLAEEVKDLKKSQDKTKKAIEHLYKNQQSIVSEQSELREVKEILLEEISRVENIALQTHEAYHNVQAYLQQQDNSMKSIGRTVEAKNSNNEGSLQDKHLLKKELKNTQNELTNRLEAFRKILQSFEMNINNNNRKIAEDMREIKAWVAQNSVSQEDLQSIIQSNPNTQRQLVNEVNNQKNLVNQVAQNSLKQGNEIKEISKVLNGLKDYTLEALQQLGQKNSINERRISSVEKGKVSQGSAGKQSDEDQQLATDFKNFKEYTMEALQELRAYNNRNSKRINHIESKESENPMVPVGDMVSQEVEKFFSKLGDGKLLEKVLEETDLSMRDVNTFVNIIKMLSEGDVNGVMNSLNQLAGGNLMEQLMNAKEGLLKEFKPVINLLNKFSGENLDDVMKYASWVNNLMGGSSEKEATKVNNNQRQQKPQKAQKKKEFGLEDLFQWFE